MPPTRIGGKLCGVTGLHLPVLPAPLASASALDPGRTPTQLLF